MTKYRLSREAPAKIPHTAPQRPPAKIRPVEIMRSILFITALRVPLLCALALASLAPLGAFSFSPFRGMLEGLFDVSGWVAFWVATASWLPRSWPDTTN